jgi:antitoxin (DNA-binding transcriptional repressor) of toxin-antitoxin stability system
MKVDILDARSRLSSLIVAAERDEEVILERNGIPVVKIVKYTAPKVLLPGAWKDKIIYNTNWNSVETNLETITLFTESVR